MIGCGSRWLDLATAVERGAELSFCGRVDRYCGIERRRGSGFQAPWADSRWSLTVPTPGPNLKSAADARTAGNAATASWNGCWSGPARPFRV